MCLIRAPNYDFKIKYFSKKINFITNIDLMAFQNQ